MIYGAISTDIKKSSANWNLDSDWMRKAVQYTNTISEYAFNKLKDKKITQLQLPNSPEGDAYTFYFETNESELYLKKHLAMVASTIQNNLYLARESILVEDGKDGIFLCGYSTNQMKLKLKTIIESEKRKAEPNYNKMEELTNIYEFYEKEYNYIGNIYLRVGIATSSTPAIVYYFNGNKSYRGSVIYMSEKAEENAPWVSGFGEYVDGKSIKRKNTDIIMKTIMNKNEIIQSESKYIYKQVDGFIIFIKYRMVLTEKTLREDPHVYELAQEEFRMLHDLSVAVLDKLDAYLVKIKRDSSAMYYIKRKQDFKQQRVNIWDSCSRLLSELPKGSSIGIAYGDKDMITEVTKESKEGTKTRDYFGAAVNISARMSATDWMYETVVGRTVPSSHLNRIAYADMDRLNIIDILEPPSKRRGFNTNMPNFIPYPYTVDQIPIVKINVGYSGFVYVLSKHIHGDSNIAVGTPVKWKSKNGQTFRGVITEILIGDAMIRHNNIIERIPIRILEKDRDDRAVMNRVNKIVKYKTLKF